MFFSIIVCEVFVEITILQWINEKLPILEHLRYYSNFLYLEKYNIVIALYEHCVHDSGLTFLAPSSQWAKWTDVQNAWCHLQKFTKQRPVSCHYTDPCLVLLGNPMHPLTSLVTIMMTLWSALRPAAEKCHPWDAAEQPQQSQPPPLWGRAIRAVLGKGMLGSELWFATQLIKH